jgi:hypothetical protein
VSTVTTARAVRNDDVTGITGRKQEKVIRESAQAPRDQAAKEFPEERAWQGSNLQPPA